MARTIPAAAADSSTLADSGRDDLLNLLPRLAFVLHAEAKGLLPTENPLHVVNDSVLRLYDELRAARAACPGALSRRLVAWPRLAALLRFGDEQTGGGALFSSQPPARPSDIDDQTLFKLLTRLLILDGKQLCYRALEVEQLGAVYESLQPGPERRRTSSHYTPRQLADSIVRRTLEPLLLAMGERPSSAELLALKICDPAMGSGVFLLAACRFLGAQVAAAWLREGAIPAVTDVEIELAKRRVAQRCLYGVDKNRRAVVLARLSLWLEARARDLPLTFVDHALRHGDSLVGLSLEQLRASHWRRGLDQEPLPGMRCAPDKARAIGDLIIGAFFASATDREREKERRRRLERVNEWLRSDGEIPADLKLLIDDIRERIPIFHWPLEFHDVSRFEAVVGNPPFLGGRRISGELGAGYSSWLEEIHAASKNADLCAHFFRRASDILGPRGALGLIATNTIAQGDTRTVGLQALPEQGLQIYDVRTGLEWQGDAHVTVCVVHLARGFSEESLRKLIRCNDRPATFINSHLLPGEERPVAARLPPNAELSFQGSVLAGAGFVLRPGEREALIRRDARNAARIFPFLGGEEVNTHPQQDFARWVINFEAMSLPDAERWPDLINLVRERVKPGRDRVNRETHRKYWWHHGDKRPALYRSIGSLARCLVAARVSKHLIFSFQPTNRIFSDQLIVFALSDYHYFGLLQSRIHEPWAWLLSSTMRDAGIRYASSDCFETFPFPDADRLRPDCELARAAERLYVARAQYMANTRPAQGLTTTYNQIKDPGCQDPRIVELRRLHEQLDRAVLSAYGWSEIPLPRYGTPTTAEEEEARQAFQDEVLDRLFALNAKRACEAQH